MSVPVKVGIIGCGTISGIYLETLKKLNRVEVYACADLDIERARARAEEFQVPNAYTVEQILADTNIEIIVNLTIPKAHAEVCLKALQAGKHVHVEKPLAVTREDGKRILELAKQNGLRVGSAPDTFLGGGIQTCVKLIQDGAIGQPLAASAFMLGRGPEGWHPDPAFYYEIGGGPMYDMGPYYLTALIALIGPVRQVTASAKASFEERTITSKPKYGTKVKVETPTHIFGILNFDNGAIGTMVTSFDVWGAQLPRIEIYGSEGSLSVPDPNNFGGVVKLLRGGEKDWQEVPLTHGFIENSRGLGVADMAEAIRTNRPHRASGELAYHVLDIMHAFHDSSDQQAHVTLESTCAIPAPLDKPIL